MPPHNKPLTALFDYRERDLPQFSPNGAYYTFIAPDGDNLPTLWLAASPNAPTRKILPHYDHPLTHYCWAHTNEHILFLRDNNGDETWQLHILDLKTGSIKNIVARNDVRVQSFAVCPEKSIYHCYEHQCP